jgi:hypothetical protein
MIPIPYRFSLRISKPIPLSINPSLHTFIQICLSAIQHNEKGASDITLRKPCIKPLQVGTIQQTRKIRQGKAKVKLKTL